jgi:hypothetical protein
MSVLVVGFVSSRNEPIVFVMPIWRPVYYNLRTPKPTLLKFVIAEINLNVRILHCAESNKMWICTSTHLYGFMLN